MKRKIYLLKKEFALTEKQIQDILYVLEDSQIGNFQIDAFFEKLSFSQVLELFTEKEKNRKDILFDQNIISFQNIISKEKSILTVDSETIIEITNKENSFFDEIIKRKGQEIVHILI